MTAEEAAQRRAKLVALLNDAATTPNERKTAQRLLERLDAQFPPPKAPATPKRQRQAATVATGIGGISDALLSAVDRAISGVVDDVDREIARRSRRLRRGMRKFFTDLQSELKLERDDDMAQDGVQYTFAHRGLNLSRDGWEDKTITITITGPVADVLAQLADPFGATADDPVLAEAADLLFEPADDTTEGEDHDDEDDEDDED